VRGAALELDHVILAGPELAALVDLVRRETGGEPAPGGRHVGHGTHNALAHLGDRLYLELLALDPEGPEGTFGDGIRTVHRPALHTWCVRGGDADDVARRIGAAGATPRRLPMSRRRADGSLLAWELVFVDEHPFGPLVPFFVDWLGARHPAPELPQGLELEGLDLAHPHADELLELPERLGDVPREVTVRTADEATLRARFRSPLGTWQPPVTPRPSDA
jgi:hypothetical protein